MKSTTLMALTGAPVWWALLRDDGTSARFLHRFLAGDAWRELPAKERLRMVLGFIASPFLMPLLLLGCTVYLGPGVKQVHGKGFARQMLEQLTLLVGACIPPPFYYVFQLHEAANRRHALDYLYRFELKRGLWPFLKTYLSSHETLAALSDKMLFAERCRQHDIPVVPAIGFARDGCYQALNPQDPELPPRNLFVKSLHGAGGRNAERWHYDGGIYRDADGRALASAQLVEHLEKLSRDQPYVVRPWLENHPDLLDLCCGVLSTARVLTIRDESGGFEATHAVFKMARDRSALVDNASRGAIASKVDMATGELGRATDMGLERDSRWWDRHPMTGATVTGRKLPAWDRVLATAVKAHEAFPDQVVIGWDIALLETGPELVEGNKGPGIDLMQRANRTPLGSGRFGELLAFHLRRAQEERKRRQTLSESPGRNS